MIETLNLDNQKIYLKITLSIESVEILSKHIPYSTQILKKEKIIKNHSIQIYLSLFTTFIFFLICYLWLLILLINAP